MNYLGINCSIGKRFGRVIVVILNSEFKINRLVFRSPSVFSLQKEHHFFPRQKIRMQ